MDRVALIRGAAFALGVLVSSVAAAQPSAVSWPNVVLKYATDGTPLLHPRVPLASTAAGGGAATLNATQRLAIGNAMANLQLTRNVPLLNLAKVARIAAWGMGPLALLGLALDTYEYVGGQWVQPDPLAPPYGDRWYRNGMANGACRQTPASCSYGDALAAAISSPCVGNPQYVDCRLNGSVVRTSGDPNNPSSTLMFTVPIAYTYAPNGQVVTLNGAISAGPVDEAAPDSGGTVPGSESGLEADIVAALQAQPTLAGQVLDAALASSAARAELLADAMGITGPATVDGGTTTSTKVDTAGTTTIQTATTYNLSYQGDTVNLTQTKVETITDPANNVTTTTTTTATPTGEPPPPEEQSKFCEEFPEASACQELGEHEPDGELGEEQRALSWSPELSAAGSCPAPITLSIMGSTQSLEWSSVCDLASGVRPVVIALAWLSAAVFVFGVGRVTAS